MMAAAQPFISRRHLQDDQHAEPATVEDCQDAYIDCPGGSASRRLALYRDGSKLSQPLASMLRPMSTTTRSDERRRSAQQTVVAGRRADRRARHGQTSAAQAAEPAQGLHPEGGGRRPQGLSAHRRVRGRHARRDLHRHAQGRRGLPLADEQLRDRRSRSACNTACRWRSSSRRSPSRGSSRRASSRATTRSRWRRRCSTTSSASSPISYLDRTDLAHVAPDELRHDAIGKGTQEGDLGSDAVARFASTGFVRGNLRLLAGGSRRCRRATWPSLWCNAPFEPDGRTGGSRAEQSRSAGRTGTPQRLCR